jgi:hypothetical protein
LITQEAIQLTFSMYSRELLFRIKSRFFVWYEVKFLK